MLVDETQGTVDTLRRLPKRLSRTSYLLIVRTERSRIMDSDKQKSPAVSHTTLENAVRIRRRGPRSRSAQSFWQPSGQITYRKWTVGCSEIKAIRAIRPIRSRYDALCFAAAQYPGTSCPGCYDVEPETIATVTNVIPVQSLDKVRHFMDRSLGHSSRKRSLTIGALEGSNLPLLVLCGNDCCPGCVLNLPNLC